MILALVIASGIGCLLVVYLHHSRRSDKRSHHIVLLDGFPAVHVPVSHNRNEAILIAQALQGTYKISWDKMARVYQHEVGPAQIVVIGLSDGIVHEKHKNVLWIAPRDKMFLRCQDSMYYWFARELHNIFRYQLYGMDGIGRSINEDDGIKFVAVEKWIDLAYGN